MKKTSAVSLVLAFLLLVLSYPVYAAESPVYDALLKEEPLSVTDATLDGLYEFFRVSDTDTILDPAVCNYGYGLVSVGGMQRECHVYMRTFDVTDIGEYTAQQAPLLAADILSAVKEAVSDKYLKCIARTYSVRVSGTGAAESGEFSSFRIRILIAVGEKTEDRAALRRDYIARTVEPLSGLSSRDRILAINDIILGGQFRYDTGLTNRCSTVQFVRDGIGVCEEYAGLTSLLLDALGYENYIITGTCAGIQHMWNIAVIDGRYYHLDILHNGPIDENGVHMSINRTYLLISTETISATHISSFIYNKYTSVADYDYIFDGLPEKIEGSVENNGVTYLPWLPSLMTYAQLREQTQLYGFLIVTNAVGELTDDAYIGTGCIAHLTVNGVTVESHIICVKGDNNGDGAVTREDMDIMAGYLLNGRDASGYNDMLLYSSDINIDGSVSITDLVTVYDMIRSAHTDPEPPEPPETTGDDSTGQASTDTDEGGSNTDDGGNDISTSYSDTAGSTETTYNDDAAEITEGAVSAG